MKTLTLVLTDTDDSLEFASAHSSEFEAMEWVFGKMICQEFTAWPIGGDRERGVDMLFKDNVAELQLRPVALPDKFAHFGGLGPATVHQVWVKQDGHHGYMQWVVMTFEANTLNENDNYALDELRRIEAKGGMIYTHYLSPTGQRIDEHFANELTQLRTQRGSADVAQYLHEKQQSCSSCCSAKLPGVLFPVATHEETDHAYVERCDACGLFGDDVLAAIQLAQILNLGVETTPEGRVYITGITFEEARDLVGIAKRSMS